MIMEHPQSFDVLCSCLHAPSEVYANCPRCLGTRVLPVPLCEVIPWHKDGWK